MRLGTLFLLLIFLFGFIFLLPVVCGIEANIVCPEKVNYNEEFLCDISVSGVSDIYDLKIYIKGGGAGINKIWNGNEWQRADWYAKEMIDSDKDYEVKLIIHKEFVGMGVGELKLRKVGTSSIAFEESFEIDVDGITNTNNLSSEEPLPNNENKIDETKIEENTEDELDNVKIKEDTKEDIKRDEKIEEEGENESYYSDRTVYLAPKVISQKVINLNLQDDFKESQITVYRSKIERIVDYLVYAFILFLICVVGVLLYERKWLRQ